MINKKYNLDNYKIKTKLIMIYIFCVIIPLLVTNSVIIVNVRNSALQEQKVVLDKQLESLNYTLASAIDGCVSVSKDLYADKTLNKFLNKKYNGTLDYFNYYNKLLQNNIIRYYYTSQKIYDVAIYADNNTLINGGHFFRLDTVRDTEWYKAFKDSGQSMITYVYFDPNKKYLPTRDTARTVSVIRVLDYFEKKGIEKIIKIDLDYNRVLRDIVNTQTNSKLYICNDDYILFSNHRTGEGFRQFDSINTIDVSMATITQDISILSQDWKIYIMADKIHFWSEINQSMSIIIVLIIINLLLPTIVINMVDKSLRMRIKLTGEYLEKVKKEKFEVIECETGEDEIGELIRNYNRMVIKIKELIEVVFKGKAERQELELAKKQAELIALQSQINPHFMFNTLESIRMRSLIKNEIETADIIGELAILMRKTMNWGPDTITVEEEVAFAENYLNLQKYRFGEKLTYSLHIMEECKKLIIPKFTIVTFVENACVHGIEGIAENGHVSITVSTNYKDLFIEVSDTGFGMERQQLYSIRTLLQHANVKMLEEAESTGMINAIIRLNSYCNGKLLIDVHSEKNVGTDITLQIPL